MTRAAILGILVLALAAGASSAAPPRSRAPAAKPATARAQPAATPAHPFDAREPTELIALLAELGAKADIDARDGDNLILKATSPAGAFAVQFGGCDAKGHACKAVQFDASAEARTATAAEINGFNQGSLACRLYADKAGKPHVLYSSLVFASLGRNDMLAHVNAWRGCLADFGAFLKDPPGYLAVAP